MSEESSDEEIAADQVLETISIADLAGNWEHSAGAAIKVLEAMASFEGGDIYTLEEKDNTVFIDGWQAIPEKSSANKITWSKDGAMAHWSFEAEILKDGDADNEGIDESNIVKGKRRRGAVDYAALNKAEDERIRKKARLEGKSGNYFEDGLADDDDSDVDHEGDEEEKEVKKPPPPAPVTKADVEGVTKQLNEAKELLGRDEIIPLLSKLAKFEMTLDALKETKVGVEVNKYRKHPVEDVKTRALFLIKKWKALLG